MGERNPHSSLDDLRAEASGVALHSGIKNLGPQPVPPETFGGPGSHGYGFRITAASTAVQQ